MPESSKTSDDAEAVILSADPAVAALELVAWVAYPDNYRFRARAEAAVRDWARHRLGLPKTGIKNRTEAALGGLDDKVLMRLTAGYYFNCQVLRLQYDDGVFGHHSTGALARRGADNLVTGRTKQPVEPSNVIRDYWRASKPVMHVAAAMGHHLPKRNVDRKPPPLEHWFFFGHDWVDYVLAQAEQLRQLAITLDHPIASKLWRFRKTDSF